MRLECRQTEDFSTQQALNRLYFGLDLNHKYRSFIAYKVPSRQGLDTDITYIAPHID